MELPINLIVGDIALVPIIVAIVQLAKNAGMPVDYAPWLTGVLAVVGYALVVVVTAHPEFLQPVQTGLTALLIFLTATGFYAVSKRTAKRARAVK